ETPLPVSAPAAEQTSGTVLYDPAVILAGAKGPMGGTCCAPPEPEINYTCVPEHYIKKTDKWVYQCRCEPLCVPCFWSLFDCKHCGPPHCEHPYKRELLYKRKVTCECDACKCVPRPVAPCDHGGCLPAGGCCTPSVVPGAPLPNFEPTLWSGTGPAQPGK